MLGRLTSVVFMSLFAVVVWTGQGATNGVCEEFEDVPADFEPGPGEQTWHFVVVQPGNAVWTLTATFSDGTTVTNLASAPSPATVRHFYVTTDAGATLLSASASTASNVTAARLVLSHCDVPETTTTTAPTTRQRRRRPRRLRRRQRRLRRRPRRLRRRPRRLRRRPRRLRRRPRRRRSPPPRPRSPPPPAPSRCPASPRPEPTTSRPGCCLRCSWSAERESVSRRADACGREPPDAPGASQPSDRRASSRARSVAR